MSPIGRSHRTVHNDLENQKNLALDLGCACNDQYGSFTLPKVYMLPGMTTCDSNAPKSDPVCQVSSIAAQDRSVYCDYGKWVADNPSLLMAGPFSGDPIP